MINVKKCTGPCGRELEATEKNFHWRKDSNKFHTECRQCIKLRNQKYYNKNKDKLNKNCQEYYKKNSAAIKENKKNYRSKNKNVLNENKKVYIALRLKNEPEYKLRKNISRQINNALLAFDSKKRGNSILQYLEYTIEELRLWLESMWESWMNWDNYGRHDSNKRTWQIDHIIPQSKFPYKAMTDDNFKQCWALTNLRPLEAMENIKKGNK